MEVEYEGHTFIPAQIAYLPNTLDSNVQVESKLARHAATCTKALCNCMCMFSTLSSGLHLRNSYRLANDQDSRPLRHIR